MKKMIIKFLATLIFALLAGFSTHSANAASPIVCDSITSPEARLFDPSVPLFSSETSTAFCKNNKGKHFYVTIDGRGLNWQISGGKLAIHCPFVKKSKLSGSYYGIKVSAAAVVGGTVGIFSNKRLGICYLAGLEIGLGASVLIDELSITDL